MNSRSLKFPKGEYFFGDLCSLFPHPNYPTTLNKDWIDIPVVVITAKDLSKEDHSRLKGNVEAIMQKGSYTKDELLSEVSENIKKIKVQNEKNSNS